MRGRKAARSVALKFSLIPSPTPGGTDEIATAADIGVIVNFGLGLYLSLDAGQELNIFVYILTSPT
jgi:hypothetical protein